MAESPHTLAGRAFVSITRGTSRLQRRLEAGIQVGNNGALAELPTVHNLRAVCRCGRVFRLACGSEHTRAGSQGWRPCMQNELPTCITTPFSVLQAGGRGQAREREPAAASGCCAAACRQPLRTQQAFPCRPAPPTDLPPLLSALMASTTLNPDTTWPAKGQAAAVERRRDLRTAAPGPERPERGTASHFTLQSLYPTAWCQQLLPRVPAHRK